LLYFKPALTGEEPPDVVQYQARHPSFPHESTGDQFYDEAQWESYRRLGEHAGNVVFRYLEKFPVDRAWRRQFVENTFLEATQRWNPAHDTQTEIFRAAEDRCAELDAAVRDGAPASLRAEFFPEIGYVLATAPVAPLTPDEETRVVYFLMQAAQVMEDTWLAADLETDWALPDNEGWMNYFQRWASTASFRRWWPVLRPIYSAGFRDFVRDRFQVIIKDDFAREEPPVPGAELTMTAMRATDDALHGYAWQQWTSRQGQPDPVDFARLSALDYRLTLTADRNGARGEPVQVGFLLFEHKKIGGIDCVQWHGKQLYVPYSLVGSGIVARLLEAAIKHFTGLGARRPAELRVLLDEDPSAGLGNAGPKAARHLRPDPGYRLQRVHNINFYKSRGFVYSSPAESAGAPRMLRLKLMD
jgi:GNAT superfamily N-acetyltransferase